MQSWLKIVFQVPIGIHDLQCGVCPQFVYWSLSLAMAMAMMMDAEGSGFSQVPTSVLCFFKTPWRSLEISLLLFVCCGVDQILWGSSGEWYTSEACAGYPGYLYTCMHGVSNFFYNAVFFGPSPAMGRGRRIAKKSPTSGVCNLLQYMQLASVKYMYVYRFAWPRVPAPRLKSMAKWSTVTLW